MTENVLPHSVVRFLTMHVLQVGPVPRRVGGRNTGGVANHIWDLSRQLTDEGYDVSVLAHNLYESRSNAVVRDGVKIYGVNWRRLAKRFGALFSPAELYAVNRDYFGQFSPTERAKYLAYHLHCRSVFAELSPDVIHNHHLGFKCPIVHHERNVTLDGEPPILTSVHGFHGMMFGDECSKANHERLIRDGYALSSNLLLNSSQVRDEATELLPDLESKRYAVGINGIDGKRYRPFAGQSGGATEISEGTDEPADRSEIGDSDEITTLLYVSRLEERKGIFTLLDALSDGFPGTDVRCLVVGDGEERTAVERRIADHGIEDMVEMRGFVSELVDCYNEADVLVVPSYHEDFGLIYAEAMSCGTPVVGTTNVPESVIPNADVGVRVPPKDPDLLRDAIRDAVRTEWDAEKIRDHARTFHWERKIEEYDDIYADLVNGEF